MCYFWPSHAAWGFLSFYQSTVGPQRNHLSDQLLSRVHGMLLCAHNSCVIVADAMVSKCRREWINGDRKTQVIQIALISIS